VSVGVGETGGDKILEGGSSERRWMTAGEHAAPRGVRDLCEEKALAGGSQELAVARNKATNLVLARKPLRG